MTDFVALAPLIEPVIEQSFAQLAADVQCLWKERILLFDWDHLAPDQRRQLALQQDYQHDPATEDERQATVDLVCELHDVQRQIDELEMAPAKSAGEVIAKEDRLKALRASHAAVDQKFRVWRGDHPDAPADAVAQDGPLDQREKKALLATIGAMLEIATGRMPGLPANGVFDTQDALIQVITAKYDGCYGLSSRNLQAKFAAANKLLGEL